MMSFESLGLARTGLLVLLLALVLAVDSRSQDFTYLSNGTEITITGYTGPGGDLTIPAKIDGLPVTVIGFYAFQGSALASVTLPESVVTIQEGAFAASSLTSISIPYGLSGIGPFAFYGTQLGSVTLPSSVSSIGDFVFGECYWLDQIIFLGNAPGMGAEVFYAVVGQTTVYFYNGSTGFTAPIWNGCPSISLPSEPVITVQQPAGTVIGDGEAVDFGSVAIGNIVSKTFTIQNSGTTQLSDVNITVDGANSRDFSINPTWATALAPGQSTTFAISFSPLGDGPRAASIHVTSNEIVSNPVDVELGGTGQGSSLIAVESPGGTVRSYGSWIGYGTLQAGTSTMLQFVVRNGGSATMRGLVAGLGNNGNSNFSILINGMDTELDPGETTQFSVKIDGTVPGYYNVPLRVWSDDQPQGAVEFTLFGSISGPLLTIEKEALDYPYWQTMDAGSIASLGKLQAGSPGPWRSIRVGNNGAGQNLQNLAISLDGAGAADFEIDTSGMAISLYPSQTTIFKVRCVSLASGVRTATLRIISNDLTRSPFDISLSATAVDPSMLPPSLLSAIIVRNAPADVNGIELGASMASEGRYLVAGAPVADNAAVDSGSVMVYDLEGATLNTPTWVIDNPSPHSGDRFGAAVAISGTRVVVGAPYDSTGNYQTGRAYVYDLASQTPTVPVVTIHNPTPQTWDYFGYAVAISGARVVIGAPEDDTVQYNSGSAYVYDLLGPIPAQHTIRLNHLNALQNDRFGWSIALAGNNVAIGAPFRQEAHPWASSWSAGVVSVFELGSISPTVPVATLGNPNTDCQQFGGSLALAGNRILVGAPSTGANSYKGMVFLYDFSVTIPTQPTVTFQDWKSYTTSSRFGSSIATDGKWVAIGKDSADSIDTNGMVSVYDIEASNPDEPVVFIEDPVAAAGGAFGTCVAFNGQRLMVGDPRRDASGVDSGAVYVFQGGKDPSPDISITRWGNSGNTKVSSGTTIDLGYVMAGQYSPKSFYVRNLGSTPLEFTATIQGSNASRFTFQGYNRNVLEPGELFTAFVGFLAIDAGLQTATLVIQSNDPDESPYLINLTGTGTGIDIGIEQPVGQALVSGGSRDFGGAVVNGVALPKIFTIRNPGSGPLTGLGVSVSGAHTSDFTVDAASMGGTLAPGESTSFSVNFRPGASGLRAATIEVASNDPNENPFSIQLTGTGLVPQIGIGFPPGSGGSGGGSGGSGGGEPPSMQFGNQLVGVPSEARAILISNPGTGNLQINSVTVDGSHAADFAVDLSGTLTSIPPGEETAILVRFSPSALAGRSGRLVITSNDSVASTTFVTLLGTGVSPDPQVRGPEPGNGNGNGIYDESGLRSWSFGQRVVGVLGPVVTFPIKNEGTADLVISGITVDGQHASEFLLDTTATVVTVPPGGSTSFNLRFTPGALGPRTAALHVANNDLETPVKTVVLGGTGMSAVSAFADLASAAGLTGPAAAPDATPFNDGVSNLLKYAFNMNLAGPDVSSMAPSGSKGLPSGQLVTEGGQTFLQVQYVVRKDSGLIYTPKKSSTLAAGSFVSLTGAVTEENIDAQWKRVTIKEPCDPASESSCFSRVEVAMP